MPRIHDRRLSMMDSVIVSTGRTDKWVISRLLSVWIRTAVCAYISTIHTLILTLTLILALFLTLTLNLAVISSYFKFDAYIHFDRHLYNKH